VRIVAGSLGGRRLAAPSGRSTRPTSDKVREAIFAILGEPPPDAQVLDLFAGSGAMAIEAISRGAAGATTVESARGALVTLRANLRELGVAERVTVVAGDALAFLRTARPQLTRRGDPGGFADGAGRRAPWQSPFTWVFLDPPYATTLGADALALLVRDPARDPVSADRPDLVAADGAVVLEHDRRHLPAERVGDLVLTDQRRYGDTFVSIFRR
jgi:16S rRNA (guanine966-N2)-methyltransferase